MQKKPNNIQEVAQPLSQGEKNFKAMHVVAINRDTVPGVTDQDHVFKGLPRKLDQPTASKEVHPDEDESKESYDKGLKRKEDYYSEKYGYEEASRKVADAVMLKRTQTEEVLEEEEEIVVEKRVKFKGYLKGNQHKLDKNHNGKLDGQDFKMLRKEEAEELDELTRAALDKYADKAFKDRWKKGSSHPDHEKRHAGEKLAVAKAQKGTNYPASGPQPKVAGTGGALDYYQGKKLIKHPTYTGVKEEAEELDERNIENKMKKDAAVAAVGAQNKDKQHLSSRGMKDSVADKIRGREKMSGKDRQQYEEAELKTLGPDSKIKDNKHHNSSDYVKKNVKFAKKIDAESDKKVKHDCAMHVEHAYWGPGICIPGAHTILETADGEGIVSHYDVLFLHGVEQDISVEDLDVLVSESHEHGRKSMKEDLDHGDIDYEGEMAKAELKAICDKAGKLADMMTDDMQLEAWLQSKISRAKDYIDAVHDYLNYREPKTAAPAAPQSAMGSNYASFLNRMGEETSAINKARKAFESKLVELGFEDAPVVIREEKIAKVVDEASIELSAEEMERIKAILGSN